MLRFCSDYLHRLRAINPPKEGYWLSYVPRDFAVLWVMHRLGLRDAGALGVGYAKAYCTQCR